jgi:hypothetical protein
VDVTVAGGQGASADSSSDVFHYTPIDVTAVSPPSGPSSGCTSVKLSGWGFSTATGVNFGSVPAMTFNVVSDSEILAIAPPGSGTVDVTVASATSSSSPTPSDEYTYDPAPPPSVGSLSPSSGPSTGGQQVVITGKNFTQVTSVMFGKRPAQFVVNSATEITAIAPPGKGPVAVVVSTMEGPSHRTPRGRFTYVAALAASPTATATASSNDPRRAAQLSP